ncbi:hypothetical protein NEDG_00427 [Nematocida displodere]|uniref:DBF4-type domain-containing protein n=1 Tax=Nematocida displodere TaxID=1805483 RepID=A0A177ELH3_9MICR|nr:hypothetical protein NEDG_00427 [Nematocida displodere]
MEYRVFKHPYILIEDESGRHRPFFKEYDGTTKENVVPTIVFSPNTPKGPGSKEKPIAKPGICEMCVVRYTDYNQHIAEKDHISTVKDVANYDVIDTIIKDLRNDQALKRVKSTRKQLFKDFF